MSWRAWSWALRWVALRSRRSLHSGFCSASRFACHPPVNHNRNPSPLFFISVASKGLRIYVNGLESTLAGISISVDSKRIYIAPKLCKMAFFSFVRNLFQFPARNRGLGSVEEFWEEKK